VKALPIGAEEKRKTTGKEHKLGRFSAKTREFGKIKSY
jgi:hypothetical protein